MEVLGTGTYEASSRDAYLAIVDVANLLPVNMRTWSNMTITDNLTAHSFPDLFQVVLDYRLSRRSQVQFLTGGLFFGVFWHDHDLENML